MSFRPIKSSYRGFVNGSVAWRRGGGGHRSTSSLRSRCAVCEEDSCGTAKIPENFKEGSLDGTSRLVQIAPYRHHLFVSTPGQGSHEWSPLTKEEPAESMIKTIEEELIRVSVGRDSSSGKSGKILVNLFSDVKKEEAGLPLSEPGELDQDTRVVDRRAEHGSRAIPVLSFPRGRLYRVTRETVPLLFSDTVNQSTEVGSSALSSTAIDGIQVFICSHLQRDSRCGILGPMLKSKLESCLVDLGLAEDSSVWYSSHFGGHKFAGLMVVYIPPNYNVKTQTFDLQQEAGQMGEWSCVWYGRITPENVASVMKETLRGQVVQEHVRYKSGIF